MILEVQCPNCKKQMKYQPQKQSLGAKKCVFCGTTFTVSRDRIIKQTTATAPIEPIFSTASKRL